MKNRIFAKITILGLTTLLLTSCSELPQAEIDAANDAILMARSSGADLYVPDDYLALQDSLNGIMVTIETEKSKFIKNFSAAKQDLAGVTQYAGEIKLLTETRKEEVKLEVQNTIAQVNTLIESNRKLILEAPKGKEGTSALLAIKGEIDAIEASISEANALYDSGDYLAGLDKAIAAKDKATTINTELTDVIAKYKTNVRR